MRRETKRFNEGDGTFRVVNRVFDDPTPQNSPNLHRAKYDFLTVLAQTQDVLKCGMDEYETLKVYYDGNSWVAETQVRVHGQG